MIKVSDYVFKSLVERGVKHVFLLSGGGCMHLVDSLGANRALRYICNLHEQAAAIAAEAYGQYTNELGVALVTTGPGGTNAVTGVAGAWLDSTPCLFLSGQVKRADMKTGKGVRQMGFQEIDIVRIVESITKYSVVVTEPGSIRYHLEKACYLARHGRPGPVWLDIPLDVQAAMIDEATLASFDPAVQVDGAPDGNQLVRQVEETLRLLGQAERPVILAGNGVRLSGALNDFLQLTEILKIPVLTTWKSIDFISETHPLYAGRPGATGQRGANFTQQNSDWLLVLGARMDLGQTAFSHENFAREAAKIVVDIDQTEIAKMRMKIEVPVCNDAGAFIREMIRQSARVSQKDYSGWLARVKGWQARYPVMQQEYWEVSGGVNNYVLVDVLSDEMSGEDLLIPGSSGAASEITMQAFRVKQGMRVFNTEGLGSMGFGIPAALGGCVASGGRRTVCIDGDGGFVMNVQDLETIRRLNLSVKFFVLNNDGYGSIRNTQNNLFAGHLVACDSSSGVTLPPLRKVAESYGLGYFRLADHDDIRGRIRQVLAAAGPAICEVMIAPGQVTAPRVMSMKRADGTMVSKPLEDMYPYLSREEFASNMIIRPLVE